MMSEPRASTDVDIASMKQKIEQHIHEADFGRATDAAKKTIEALENLVEVKDDGKYEVTGRIYAIEEKLLHRLTNVFIDTVAGMNTFELGDLPHDEAWWRKHMGRYVTIKMSVTLGEKPEGK